MIANLPGWWGVTFTGEADKQNDKFTVKMGGDSFFHFSVTQAVPGKRLVWLVTDCHMPWFNHKTEWTDTQLVFDLQENDGTTEVAFTHVGLTPNVECYKDCKPGWTHWITTSLHAYLTTGTGVFKQPKA